jgi:branched-chain amino acid transport system substrate-binding protein
MEAHVKKPFIRIAGVLIALSLILPACGARSAGCSDPLGCVTLGDKQPIRIAVLLTLSGPDSPYGIDALRGVEIAAAKQNELSGHPIELVKVDDLCTAEGGEQGARQIAADPTIVGVIGATCSSSSIPAAKLLSEAGMVMISPSSTAASLTLPSQHQPGFFRTIYNDSAQGKAVANFAYRVLGLRSMSTIDDKTAYSTELTAAACEDFEKLGGDCLGRLHIDSGQDVYPQIFWISKLNTDVLYLPIYTVDGVNILRYASELGLRNALISSDGLISRDFLMQTTHTSQGMYLSGPSAVEEPQAFTQQYRARFGEEPNASYHLQGYDAAMLLFDALQKAGVAASASDGGLLIKRQALRDAIRQVRDTAGLSGPLTCSQYGDCAEPSIGIFQIKGMEFSSIYP